MTRGNGSAAAPARAERTTSARSIGADGPSGAFRRAQRREGFRLGAGHDEVGEAADAVEQAGDTHQFVVSAVEMRPHARP